jgi:hypothetical protein
MFRRKLVGWQRLMRGRMMKTWGHALSDPVTVAGGAMEQLAGELELRGISPPLLSAQARRRDLGVQPTLRIVAKSRE